MTNKKRLQEATGESVCQGQKICTLIKMDRQKNNVFFPEDH